MKHQATGNGNTRKRISEKMEKLKLGRFVVEYRSKRKGV